MSAYSTPATGVIGLPTDEKGENNTEMAIERIQSLEADDFLVSTRENDRLLVDELYFSDGSLGITALFDDWYVSMDIPLRPNKKLRELLSDVNRAFDVTSRESGYYLSNDDVALVDTFTPDGQGRITVGRDYADREIRVIVTDA